jgi:hypothetical protein
MQMLNSEYLLHYIWKFRLYPNGSLTTSDGARVEVIDPGIHNHDAGPDFFNSKIKVVDELWAGNVEIHNSSSDWVRHGHHQDKSYNSVILHVSQDINAEVKNQNGESIPQCRITIPDNLKTNADYLLSSSSRIPCKEMIMSLDKTLLHSWMDSLAIERLERKSNYVYELLERFQNSWDDVFYVLLSRSFGFGINSEEFERLALSLPLKYILKHRDNLLHVEALLFGQAGLLEEEALMGDSDETIEYYSSLKREYDFLKSKYQLRGLESFVFKKMRIRPRSFPEVRIAQLAALLYKHGRLFSQLLNVGDDNGKYYDYFKISASKYWDTHSSFSGKSVNSRKVLGKSSIDIILINTVVPILFAYGNYTKNEEYYNRSLKILESIRAEKNYITKEFAEGGLDSRTAFESQALIQLKKEYCDKKKCFYCRIGFKLLTV